MSDFEASERKSAATGAACEPPSHTFGGIEGPATHEHRKRCEDPTLVFTEEVPAPLHDCLQCLLSLAIPSRAADEQLEPVIEALEQLSGREVDEVWCRKLECERHAVELAAQLHGPDLVPPTEAKRVRCLRGPSNEKSQRALVVEAGQPVALLTRNPERFVARDKDPGVGAAIEHVLDESSNLIEQMLTIVQHEQEVLGSEEARNRGPLAASGQRQANRVGDHLGDALGFGHGSELDEEHSSRRVNGELRCHSEREPRLATAPDTGERHESM